jgi:hypothetical protein
VTDALYQEYGGAANASYGSFASYASFARLQLNYALGANPWGTSFVVGAGTAYPHCMQSEIANLSGSLTGSGAVQLGATVDGPSNPGNFADADVTAETRLLEMFCHARAGIRWARK